MKLIWVRHGETRENRQRRYLGHSDPPLSDEGIAQVSRLAERLYAAIDQPQAVYTSDLQRCRQTAEAIARRWSLPPQEVPALRELSFGDWELLTYDELMQKDAVRAQHWYDDPYTRKPPNGESLQELGARVDAWLGSLLEQSRDSEQTIVLVSHGGVIRWFEAAWLRQDRDSYWQVEGLKHGDAMLVALDGERWRGQQWQNGGMRA
ncbi:histidine phosphatase family protein [Brevibacillus sp. TJ4]|uniref:histidine phosphatase family protein n=1 Tax=Brevibacillus sp. TJ4 TaxID=3234853 RepID=UPI0037CDB612